MTLIIRCCTVLCERYMVQISYESNAEMITLQAIQLISWVLKQLEASGYLMTGSIINTITFTMKVQNNSIIKYHTQVHTCIP